MACSYGILDEIVDVETAKPLVVKPGVVKPARSALVLERGDVTRDAMRPGLATLILSRSLSRPRQVSTIALVSLNYFISLSSFHFFLYFFCGFWLTAW